MESIGVTPPMENTTCEFIHNLYKSVLDYIIHILIKKGMGFKGLGEVMDVFKILIRKEGALYKPLFKKKENGRAALRVRV